MLSSDLTLFFEFFFLLIISIKKTKNRPLPIFSLDFTLNSQIWLFYAEKWIFLKERGALLKIILFICMSTARLITVPVMLPYT